jgi:peptide/nickel transport system substrate-binding protein
MLLATACAAGGVSPTPEGGRQPDRSAPSSRPKTVTVGIGTPVTAFSIAADSTPAGGWLTLTELHSDGLVTADLHSLKQVGRLAERAPTLEDGTVSVLLDGRMRVEFHLRKGVTWHDGTPFTADDLAFSYRFGGPGGLPTALNFAVERMQSVEAPDASTFVVYYKQPYYLGTALGPHAFWPLPRHLLEPAFERFVASGNIEELLNLRYWNSEYVHLGPFRLTHFEPGEGMTFQAYESYFLGRPKLDTVRVQTFSDVNTLFSNVLVGTVDMVTQNALRPDLTEQLRQRLEPGGDGRVVGGGLGLNLRNWHPQLRPGLMLESAVLEPRVRQALLRALDREAIAEALEGSRNQVAWSWRSPSDYFYEPTKDALRPFAYDPDRARALLREAGWEAGPDGRLRHSSDGRLFRTALWARAGSEKETATMAAYWRQIGLEADEFIVPAAQARNPEVRAEYPGWNGTGSDVIELMANRTATAENRWRGNLGGYEDARAQRTAEAFYQSITEPEQMRAMRAISDFLTAEMPVVPMQFSSGSNRVLRKGVQALTVPTSDSNPPYGGLGRDAYLWNVE